MKIYSLVLLFLLIVFLSGCVQQNHATENLGKNIPEKILETRDSSFRAGRNADIPEPNFLSDSYSSESINLKNEETLEVTNKRYIVRNNIALHDNATLIVRNSILEFDNDFAYQWLLSADGNAKAILENSNIISSYPMNFEFRGNSILAMKNIKKTSKDSTFPWMTFGDEAKAFVNNSKFDATLWDRAEINIENSPSVYLEIVFPPDSSSNERFDVNLLDFSFPNENEKGIDYRVNIKNSTARGWGFTVRSQSNVTIRNAHNVVMTLVADKPWINETIYLDGLREQYYDDALWIFGDTSLRFVGVDAWQWSPLAYENNTVIVNNSHLADIAWGGGHGKIVINNSDVFFLRAREYMEIIAENSYIHSDVIAIDNSNIILVNTTVEGKIVEEGGRVTIENNH